MPMSHNKQTVETYMDGFRRGDHGQILGCLTEEVEWIIPGLFHITGQQAFDREIENPAFQGHPDITITRLTEEDDVVVAEGAVRARKITGEIISLKFCDVFEMQEGRIGRLISYLMEVSTADG